MSELQPTLYQNYIALSRYARYRRDLGRRETWGESVDRLIAFWKDRLGEYVDEETFSKVREHIVTNKVMPSMRSLMTAGEALTRDETAGYNCAYTACEGVGPEVALWDSKLQDMGFDEPIHVSLRTPIVFDCILYALLCGTGMGFSVERQFVNTLPTVGRNLSRGIYKPTETNFPRVPVEDLSTIENNVIQVADSKYGWASSLRILLVELYNGNFDVEYDLSRIRPAGTVLKTFGGRASGPGPLKSLFDFAIALFREADGRKLTSIECHDLVCKIAESVVSGGVRRSALISLSNLSDDRMRHAKSGEWWNTDPQRALANNSVCYTEKPTVGTFMREWESLYMSRSGERGIFNREAARKLCEKIGRDPNHEWGTNPCCFTGDMRLLTSDGYLPFSDLANLDVVSIVASDGSVTEGKVWSSGEKEIVEVKLECGKSLKCTPDHLFMLNNGSECQAADLAGKTLSRQWFDMEESSAVVAVSACGVEEVFDFTEPKTHWGVVEGCVVHNSEILLRPAQFCNLSEIVVRHDDTLDSLLEKAEIAAILGTWQATLTNFTYLPPIWKQNCEEERLLGVSLTGIMDHPILSNVTDEAKHLLNTLRDHVNETNKKWAKQLNINPAAATTCVKPSGTVSQLVDAASGLHPRYSQFYIRRVRADKKDPLATTMQQAGFPCEQDVMQPANLVFSFPIKAPEVAVMRDDRSALDQLEHWLMIQDEWCEHKPSITVYVREHEWLEVGAWVYKHFDKVSGVSFLPHSDHSYQQAPYEEIDEETYLKLVAELPTELPMGLLAQMEKEDMTTGTREFACTGGACEI